MDLQRSALARRRAARAQFSLWDLRESRPGRLTGLRGPAISPPMLNFNELSAREILALAITNEEEDSRIYQAFADQ